MKQCKEFKLIENKYVPCPNPVEDEIRAWGQIINPVRCKEHRARNRFYSRAEQDKRRIQEIRNHNCKTANCHPTVCTAFDY